MYKTPNFRLFSFVTLLVYALSLLLINNFFATKVVAIEETCHKGKYCDMKVIETIKTGGYNPNFPNVCNDEVTTYPWGYCEDSENKDESCFTSNQDIEVTRRFGLVKENNYTSLSCILWVTGLLGSNTAIVIGCGSFCVGTIGIGCVGCVAGFVGNNTAWALEFDAVCKKDVCQYSGLTEVTKRQVVCAIAYE
jgi:hypothetical protein